MATPNCSKRARSPRRPFDSQRLVNEMRYVGEYGLKSKRELRVAEKICFDIKKRARELLIETDQNTQMVAGRSLMKRLHKNGLITDINYTDKKEIITHLENILDMEITKFLDRRLQSRVFALGIAKSIHEARVLINHRHILVNGNICDQPGMFVWLKNEGGIEISPNSTLMSNKAGRTAKKKLRAQE
ncbi:small subunit ribosomal protein S9e [Nematocida sp. AWRm80]|nr:small subunit ribosomal protein S9e [Nematocida sp. AWRm80]